MKTVLMHGQSLSEPGKVVEMNIPAVDVQAYRASGFVEGGIPVLEDEKRADGESKETHTEAVPAAPIAKPKRKAKK